MAFFDLGLANPIVALSIAVLKATLVVLFFMHLKYGTRLTWVIAGAAVFWLGILLRAHPERLRDQGAGHGLG